MTGPLGVVVTIVLFLVVLGSLVLIHELGHFVVARLAGIRVLEFGIGFPPRARVLVPGSRAAARAREPAWHRRRKIGRAHV